MIAVRLPGVQVPRKKPGPKPQPSGRLEVKIELMVAPDWKERVERAAQAVGLTMSGYIRLAVSERMARDPVQPPKE